MNILAIGTGCFTRYAFGTAFGVPVQETGTKWHFQPVPKGIFLVVVSKIENSAQIFTCGYTIFSGGSYCWQLLILFLVEVYGVNLKLFLVEVHVGNLRYR